MPSDLRIRYDVDVRRAAAELFEEGYGYHAAATVLALPPSVVKQWCYKFGAVGLDGLLQMGGRQVRYTYEQKLAAAKAVVEDGEKAPDAMASFGIASRSALLKWCKAYREGGAEALRPEPKGRPKGSGAAKEGTTREQELEVRVRKLEAENAYLKKLAALRAEKSLRTGRRQRP